MRLHQDAKLDDWFHAAERGDLAAVVDFLDSGLDINAVDWFNSTALIRAVLHCHVEVISVLLEHGASLSPVSCDYTALTFAVMVSRSWGDYWPIRAPDRRPLDLILAAGARYELREAVLLNDLGLAIARLDEGADPDTDKDSYHGPLLKVAAELGYLAIVDLLLDRGADLEATDDLGRKPLLSAAYFGQFMVVRRLLDRGADINAADFCEHTALVEAAFRGHQDIVDLLLSRGAKRSLADAVILGDVALVDELLRNGADPCTSSHEIGSAVIDSVIRGNVSIVRLILDHCAARGDKPIDDYLLLLSAAAQGHVEIVQLLIERGADLEAVGRDGKTALALATEEGHHAVVEELSKAVAAAERRIPESGTAGG